MNVHIGNGPIMPSLEIEEDIYMFRPESSISAYPYLTLVSANEQDFLKSEIVGSKRAQELHQKIDYHGYNLLNYLRKLL